MVLGGKYEVETQVTFCVGCNCDGCHCLRCPHIVCRMPARWPKCAGGGSGSGTEDPKPEHVHAFEETWTYNAQEHWHKAVCGHDEESGRAAHIFLDDKCTVCGYVSVTVPVQHTVIFMADEQEVSRVNFTEGDASVQEPPVPDREHYTGRWQSYTLGNTDITVYAEYTAIEYTITFDDGTDKTTVTYTAETVDSVIPPQPPTREHYKLSWVYELQFEQQQVVELTVTPIEYTVTFTAVGNQPIVCTYTIETVDSFKEPQVPVREHYDGSWEQYELTFDNEQTVAALYTPIVYTIVFEADGLYEEYTYTIETVGSFEEPLVPAREHYNGYWEDHGFNFTQNNVVHAYYVPIVYSIEFRDCSGTRVVLYTVETVDEVVAPEVTPMEHYTASWGKYNGPTFESQQQVPANYRPIRYTITFDDGVAQTVKTYTVESADSINPPPPTAREYYNGGWESFTPAYDDAQRVHAVYTPIEYSITFVDGDSRTTVTYTVETADSVTPPEVVPVPHYDVSWSFELAYTMDQTVEISRIPIEYWLNFGYYDKGDWTSVGEVHYTVETVDEIVLPEPDEREHYTVEWEDPTPRFEKDQRVSVRYTPIVYSFMLRVWSDQTQGYVDFKRVEYTAEDSGTLALPAVPERRYYTAQWGAVDFQYDDSQVIQAEYTPIVYSIEFVCGNASDYYFKSEVVEYTVENMDALKQLPETAHRLGYTGEWPQFEVEFENLQRVQAVYTPRTYTIHLDCAGCGTLDSNEVTITFNEQVSLPSPKEDRCYEFWGWFSDDHIVDIYYQWNELQFPEFDWEGGEDLTLTARYEFTQGVLYSPFGEGFCVYMTPADSVQTQDGYLEILSEYHGLPVTEVYPYALQNCTNITELVIPEGITHIQQYAFQGCTGLMSIEFPSTLTCTASGILYDVGKIQTMVFRGTIEQWSQIEMASSLARYAQEFLLGSDPKEVTEIVLDESVTEIKPYVFSYFTKVTSFVAAGKLTSIGSSAFEGCSKLQSVQFDTSALVSIGHGAFRDCTQLTIFPSIPETVEAAHDAFDGTPLDNR